MSLIKEKTALAYVNEDECIGCALCLSACPFDAIIGALHQAHTVLADECTGCELCIAPCPVDCISMRPDERPVQLTVSRAHLKMRVIRHKQRYKEAQARGRAARDAERARLKEQLTK